MSSKEYLKELVVEFSNAKSQEDEQEALLEGLQPHRYLQCLKLFRYQGAKLPVWASHDNDAIRAWPSHLVKIVLWELPRLELLSALSSLSFLKHLQLDDIPNLKYMESDGNVEDLPFFPSLEELELCRLSKIKRWWKDGVMSKAKEGVEHSHGISSFINFPRLHKLNIYKCPNMKSMPPCPHLKEFRLDGFNEGESLSPVRELLRSCASYLRALTIHSAPELKFEDEDKMPWESLHALSRLSLRFIKKMETLPKGIQYLSALEFLEISFCQELTGLPECLGCCISLQSVSIVGCVLLKWLPEAMIDLTSLTRLHIQGCDELVHRCRSTNGEHWPKIQHIPDICLEE